MRNYSNCWITLNRQCNLRCEWCYARDTNFRLEDDANIDTVFKIIDICVEKKIKHIALIGGEPTLYKNLDQVVKKIKENDIKCGIVTNGLKLADKDYLKKLMELGIDSFSISLKGENEKVFKQVSGYDGFYKVMQAIKNCSEENASFSVSMVLTNDNIPSFINGLDAAQKFGAKSFHLSFCYDFNMNSVVKNPLALDEIVTLPEKFQSCYDDLCKRINNRFSLFQTLPLCLWDEQFIKKMIDDKKVTSICQLLSDKGLLFDTEGNMIPCNAMYRLKLGKLGVDYNDGTTLDSFRNSEKIQRVYNKLRGVPSQECLECKKLKYCGGGCVCQWTNFNFQQIKKYIKEEI